jgi:hypothetical protein
MYNGWTGSVTSGSGGITTLESASDFATAPIASGNTSVASALAAMGASYEISTTAPTDTTKWWIDDTTGEASYYNGSAWVGLPTGGITTLAAATDFATADIAGGNASVKNQITYVNTTTDLRALTYSGQNLVVRKGYYVVNDIEECLFYWDSTSTETDNGGTIFQVSGVTTGRWKLNRPLTHFDVRWFGAKENKAADATTAIQNCIDYALTTKTRKIIFGFEHLVTDIDVVKKFNSGLVFEGSLNTNQPSNTTGNIVVTGATSQGIDISGGSFIRFQNLAIAGDPAAEPKCLLFMSRIVGAAYCSFHQFNNVGFFGNASLAMVYNFAGESCVFSDCNILNRSVTGHGYYGTSKNSLGLTTKFDTPDNTASPLTISTFNNCNFANSYLLSQACNTYGAWFERDIVTGGDRTISNIAFNGCYFVGRGLASVLLQDVDNNVSFNNCTDESYSTASVYANISSIKTTGNATNYLKSLRINNCTFFGGRTNTLNCANLKGFIWLGSEVYNATPSVFANINGCFVHEWQQAFGTFTVTGTATRCRIYTDGYITDKSFVNLNGASNNAQLQRFGNSNYSFASTLIPGKAGALLLDDYSGIAYIAKGETSASWSEILSPARNNSAPTSGNYLYGQIATLWQYSGSVGMRPGSSLGLVCLQNGTAGTLSGITGSITSGSTTLTVNSTTGITEGCWLLIPGAGVAAGNLRPYVVSISGLNVTVSVAASTTVTGAAISYTAATFAEFGNIKLQSTLSATPGTITSGSSYLSSAITVTGAVLGDIVIPSFSLDLVGCSISAYVSAANTAKVVITNNTGGSVTLGAGTLTVRCFKQ